MAYTTTPVCKGKERPGRSRAMNIFKTMAVRSIEDATRAIPVIDFAPAFSLVQVRYEI